MYFFVQVLFWLELWNFNLILTNAKDPRYCPLFFPIIMALFHLFNGTTCTRLFTGIVTGIIKTNSYFQYKYYTYFVCLQVHVYCITKYVLILIILWVLSNTAGYNWGNIFDPSTKVCIGFHQTVSHTSQKGKSPKRHVWVWHNSFTFWYWNIQIKA